MAGMANVWLVLHRSAPLFKLDTESTDMKKFVRLLPEVGRFVCLVSVVANLSGCGQQSQTDLVPPVKSAATAEESRSMEGAAATGELAAGGGAGLQEFDGMKFMVPEDWKQLELSAMQKGIIAAKFGIPTAGESISLTLSTSGGSLEDNLQRWEGQFSGGPAMIREAFSADGKEATLVRLQGQFSPGFGRPDEDGWGMLGVVIPLGSFNYYIKLTGPQEEVAKAEEQFLEFCRSARAA